MGKLKSPYYLLRFITLYPGKKKQGNAGGVWLIDERWGKSAEDNSLHFFIYLRTQHPELEVYYIVSPNSPQKEMVEPHGNVVPSFSRQHLMLLHRAEVLLSTDTLKALAYPFEVMPFFKRNTINVFLQHGVSGNKTMTYYKERHPYFNMVVTSNDREKQSFIDVYGFQEEEVAVTGLARFDTLPLHRSPNTIRKILVAPTWRKWLAKQHEITESVYFKEWGGFLQSPRLVNILEQHNIRLIFQPHFNMMKFIGHFKGKTDRIEVIGDAKVLLQDYIIECDLLITDYSSVMYDFFYQNKPVYSMMFDRAEWECPPNGPPLLDFENDLPLCIFDNKDHLLDHMEEKLPAALKFSDSDLQKFSHLFKYRDQNSCQRIYQHILNMKLNQH